MPAFSWNHSAFVKGEACKRRKPPCIGDGFLRFESINWLLPAGFFGLPLRLHETVQLFMIAIRFAVHSRSTAGGKFPYLWRGQCRPASKDGSRGT